MRLFLAWAPFEGVSHSICWKTVVGGIVLIPVPSGPLAVLAVWEHCSYLWANQNPSVARGKRRHLGPFPPNSSPGPGAGRSPRPSLTGDKGTQTKHGQDWVRLLFSGWPCAPGQG